MMRTAGRHGVKRFDTTLGELVAAVTEASASVTHDAAAAHALVSYILADLFRSRRAQFKKRSRRVIS